MKVVLLFCAKRNAEAIVAKLREGKYSTEAAIIGEVTEEMPGRVVVTTEIGAETLLPPPGENFYQESVKLEKGKTWRIQESLFSPLS